MNETQDRGEAARLARLAALQVLDSTPEPIFDQAAQLAAELCGTPIALIGLIDERRQWFKANVGLDEATETPRALAFCTETCRSDELLEIPDAALDPRFTVHPMVLGDPHIRFYAGAPIVMPGGERVGALCVVDRVPRTLDAAQRAALLRLGRMVAAALEERERRLQLMHQLARAEATYRSILEAQTELVSLADASGRLSYVNRAYAAFFGSSADDMVGRSLHEFVDEADREAVAAHLQSVLAGGASTGINRMVNAAGEQRWVAWTNHALPGTEAGTRTIHSVGRDVTAQKLAEEALAAAERRARLLYEATPAMMHSIDPTGRVISVSDAWLRAMGYARQEVLGRVSVDFLTPESRQRAVTQVLPAFFATGRVDEISYQMVRKDGSVMDVLMSAVLERDAAGQPLRSLAVVQDVTEQRLTAAQLRESRHRLQLVLDSLPARVSYWDSDSRNRFGNRAFQESFGADASVILGRHAREVLGPEWYGRIQPHIEAGLAGRPSQVEASTDGGPDGPRDTVLHFTPDTRDGHVHGLFVFGLDVTDRRRAERALADREARLKLLIDGVHDYAICMLDAQGHVATWNAGAQAVMGYPADEVVGRHFRMFFTAEDAAAGLPEQELAEAAATGRFESEGWRLRADGRRIWSNVVVGALKDAQGGLVGYAKITRDLSEQRSQRLLLERTVELAPCAMLLIDAGGLITMANAQAATIFGHERAALLGQPLEKLIPASVRARHRGHHAAYLHDGQVRMMGTGQPLTGLHASGEEFPVEVGLSTIETARGPAALAAVFDISERRRQQALLEQALADKETLLKEVYHRVKNNLQVVQSLLSLQRQSLADAVACAAIDDTAQRVRAMALVHEKLYQSGSLSAVSLRAYVQDLVDQIAEAMSTRGRNVRLLTDIADLHTGLDNAVPLGLLVTELVTNCLKHAFVGQAGGEVRISLLRQADGDWLRVADNGCGLPEGFDAAGRPTSMGLQLAQGLARQLGGTLVAGSQAGAVFSARLSRL